MTRFEYTEKIEAIEDAEREIERLMNSATNVDFTLTKYGICNNGFIAHAYIGLKKWHESLIEEASRIEEIFLKEQEES